MTSLEDNSAQSWSRWRLLGWSNAAFLLLLPLVAMQFTEEVQWDVADFTTAGIMLLTVGALFELAVRKSGSRAYRAGAGLALVAAFLLIWANAAVGLIGSENNDINMVIFAVLAMGLIGAVIGRFKPHGMALAMVAMAFAQAAIAVTVLATGMAPPESSAFEILAINGFFVVLFAGSALLFRRAS
jgi:hypothetical protein